MGPGITADTTLTPAAAIAAATTIPAHALDPAPATDPDLATITTTTGSTLPSDTTTISDASHTDYVAPSRIMASATPEGQTQMVTGAGPQVLVSQGPGVQAGGFASGDQTQVITHTGPGVSSVSSQSVSGGGSGSGNPAAATAGAGGGTGTLETLLPGSSIANPAAPTLGQSVAPLSSNDGAAKPTGPSSSASSIAHEGLSALRWLVAVLVCALWSLGVMG